MTIYSLDILLSQFGTSLLPYKVIEILITIFPVLYIISPWLIYSITGSLYILFHLFCPSPCYPALVTIFAICMSLFLLCLLALFFRFCIYVKSYSICSFSKIKKNFFWPYHMASGILVPWAGIEPMPPALEVCNRNHWKPVFVLKPLL